VSNPRELGSIPPGGREISIENKSPGGAAADLFRFDRETASWSEERRGAGCEMKSLEEYLELAAVAHGHLCAGQVLGVRLAMLGLKELGVADPIAEPKRLVTYVEIDRCVTDAVALVANCRLGKRALKFRDWGKVAATFCDLKTGRAVRIAAKESSKQAAKELYPQLPREEGQQKAYAELADETLFERQWVRVEVLPEELPGFKGPRVVCAECGEGINFKREVVKGGRTLCRACAGERYYEMMP
jgi:formylmethanofuran dehydrogenase subunit E